MNRYKLREHYVVKITALNVIVVIQSDDQGTTNNKTFLLKDLE